MLITDFNSKGKLNWLIVISSCDKNIDLETDIKKFLQNKYAPEHIIILHPQNGHTYKIADYRIPNFSKISLTELAYDVNGDVFYSKSTHKISENLYLELALNTYSSIFQKHDSVIKASHQSYFKLPSGDFATHFIRIANIFVKSEEINILAIFLLKHLKTRPDIIYCDTPSIFSIIYSCILLKNNSDATGIYNPKIVSYSSYTISRDDIENDNNSLYIISTSVNGNLPEKLNGLGIDWSKIVVLFSFEPSVTKRYIPIASLDIKKLVNGDFDSLNASDFREKFPNRTFELKFETGQFIPAPPTVSHILLDQKHAPESLSKFMHNYKDYDFISCYKGKNSKGKTRDIYFDVSKLLRDFKHPTPNHFEQKTKKLLINQLSINIRYIVYVDELESRYLAEKIKEYYLTEHQKDVKTIYYKDLNLSEDFLGPSSFLICSSCISDGKKITNVSRILRSQESSQILYFNGFVRCKDNEAFKHLKNSIKYGEYGFITYGFITIDEIFLPNEDSDTISWENEKSFLKILLHGFDEFGIGSIMDDETKHFFQNRLDELEDENGLTTNVFLKKKNHSSLVLNKNFAFFDFADWTSEDISQSKVYFTILSVLHNYRNIHKINQTVYERFILSPENFNRYNDGIIQAALLRSASKNELNYQIDVKASQAITTAIISSIDESENKDSAPYEFLIAICIKKLILCKEDLLKICASFHNHADAIIRVFVKVIENIADQS